MNFAHDQSFSLTQHNWELPTLMEALFHRYTKANGFGPPPLTVKENCMKTQEMTNIAEYSQANSLKLHKH